MNLREFQKLKIRQKISIINKTNKSSFKRKIHMIITGIKNKMKTRIKLNRLSKRKKSQQKKIRRNIGLVNSNRI